MTQTILPRLQASAYQEGSGWTWELKISLGPADPIYMSPKIKFVSKEAALTDCRAHCVGVIQEISKALGSPVPTEMMDLNAGVIRPIADFERNVQ